MRFAVALLSSLAVGCATTLPDRTAEAALYTDLRKAVEVQEGTGWVVDRHELEEVLPSVARSVCAAEPAARLGVIRWIEAEVAARGGPAEEAWRRSGRDDGAIGELLSLERTRDLLRAGHERAEEDCPFWLEPDGGFAGIHGDADRLVLMAESLGGFGLIFRDGRVGLGGGGGGRLLLGWGLDVQRTLALGLEVGGAAELPADDDGARTVVARFTAAAPLLFRMRDSLTVVDLEVAPTVRFTESSLRPPGLRVSIGGGLSTLRAGGFMPHGLLWIGYEYQPPHAGFGPEHSIRVGTRVGLDWDP